MHLLTYLILCCSYLLYFLLEETSKPLLLFLLVFIQSLLWVVLFFSKSKLRWPSLLCGLILVVICCRSTAPMFEDDYFRYFWDGGQVAQGKNPYAQAPKNVVAEGSWIEIHKRINFPHLVTIYPPGAQFVFALLYCFSFGSLSAFLWLLSVGGATLFLVCYVKLLKQTKCSHIGSTALLMLQHPLIAKEWFQSCHYDPWLLPPILLAMSSTSPFWKGAWLAIGAQMKFTSLAALVSVKERQKLGIYAIGLLLFLLLPALVFSPDLRNLFETLQVFGTEWEMNTGIYRWLHRAFYFVGIEWSMAGKLSRFVCLGLWGGFVLFLWRNSRIHRCEKVFWALFLLVYLSPVCNSWYFTWSLPFLVWLPKQRQLPLLVCYSLVTLSYTFYNPKDFPISYRTIWDIEHILIIALLSYVVCATLRSRKTMGEKKA